MSKAQEPGGISCIFTEVQRPAWQESQRKRLKMKIKDIQKMTLKDSQRNLNVTMNESQITEGTEQGTYVM